MSKSAKPRGAAAKLELTGLPLDALSHVCYCLTLAHDIAVVGKSCRQMRAAALNALKARPFTGEVVTLDGHGADVNCVAVAPGPLVLTGSDEFDIIMWRGGAKVNEILDAHKHRVWSLAVLPGGRFISVSQDGDAKVWTLDGNLERTIKLAGCLYEVVCMPDGLHFVAAAGVIGDDDYGVVEVDDDDYDGESNKVWLCHVDGTVVCTLDQACGGHTRKVQALAVTRDGRHIVSGSTDRLVKVWSVASQSLVSTCGGHTGYISDVVAMPDCQRIISCSLDRSVKVWLLDGTLVKTIPELHDDTVRVLLPLPDNQHALSGSDDGTIKLFNVNDGAVLRNFEHLHTECVRSLALHPDGLRFVSGSFDNTACIVEHGLALAPTTTASEIKVMVEGAETELRLAQEKVRLAEEKLRSLKQWLTTAK